VFALKPCRKQRADRGQAAIPDASGSLLQRQPSPAAD